MNKKDALKLKPGMWVVVEWNDSLIEAALVLEKPSKCKGDMSIKLFYPDCGDYHSHAVHTQIAFAHCPLEVPKSVKAAIKQYQLLKSIML